MATLASLSKARIFSRVLLHRWARLEEARVAAEEKERAAQTSPSKARAEAGGAEALSHQEKLARRNQIFNAREGFAMLSKELSEMMQCPVRALTLLCHGMPC